MLINDLVESMKTKVQFAEFGDIALICFALFFSASAIAGISTGLEIVLFMLGVLLLMLEIFVIPGFGIAGIAGIGCTAAAMIMAMVLRVRRLTKRPDFLGFIILSLLFFLIFYEMTLNILKLSKRYDR